MRILILLFPVVGLVVFAYSQTSAELLIEIGGLTQASDGLDILATATRGLVAFPVFMQIPAEAFCSIGEEIVIYEHGRVGWSKSFRAACNLAIVFDSRCFFYHPRKRHSNGLAAAHDSARWIAVDLLCRSWEGLFLWFRNVLADCASVD